jgi:hypothetical protein
MVSAASFIPLSVEVAGLTIGVSEIGVALSLVYYASINISFAVRFITI